MKKFMYCCVLVSFILNGVMPPQELRAQAIAVVQPDLGQTMQPMVLKGVKIFPSDPFKFDFIVDPADSGLEGDALKAESQKLIKYFLASLTTPETEMWVNLSPLEPDRIIPAKFGETEMGRDLLIQDHILKQTSSALTDPGTPVGREFWDKVYARAYDLYGTTDVPAEAVNKVWILPEQAEVYEDGDKAWVMGMKLKVMTETDYAALAASSGDGVAKQSAEVSGQVLSQDALRTVVLPVLAEEVNSGKSFAGLRQIYHSMILATWFKRSLKASVLGQVYMDQDKTSGIDIEDKQAKVRIYEEYLEAFKKGAYNLIREEYDTTVQEVVARKYFSGGIEAVKDSNMKVSRKQDDPVRASQFMQGLSRELMIVTAVILISGCDPQSGRLGTVQNQIRKNVDDPAPSVPAQIVYGPDSLHTKYRWSETTVEEIDAIRKMLPSGFVAMDKEQQIVEVMRLVKYHPDGMRLFYDHSLVGSDELEDQGRDLDLILKTQRAICTGFSRAFWALMLGDNMIISTGERPGQLKDEPGGHSANMVRLPDGRLVFTDGSTDFHEGFFKTKAFWLEDHYELIGDGIWKLRVDLPWEGYSFKPDQEFLPAGNQNDLYRYMMLNKSTPYNSKQVLNDFNPRYEAIIQYVDKAKEYFDNKQYDLAIDAFERAKELADQEILRARNAETSGLMIEDEDLETYMLKFINDCNQSIDNAKFNQQLLSGQSGRGTGQEVVGSGDDQQGGNGVGPTPQEVEAYNAIVEQFNQLMNSGAEKSNQGNEAGAQQDFEEIIRMLNDQESPLMKHDEFKKNLEEMRRTTDENRKIITFNLNIKKVNEVFNLGVERFNAGNKKAAKTAWEEARRISGEVRDEDEAFWRKVGLDKMEIKINKYLKSVDNSSVAADNAAIVSDKSTHFIFDYHYSRERNMQRLYQQIRSPDIDIIFLEEAESLAGFDLLNKVSQGQLSPQEAMKMGPGLSRLRGLLNAIYDSKKLIFGAIFDNELQAQIEAAKRVWREELVPSMDEALYKVDVRQALELYQEVIEQQARSMYMRDAFLYDQLSGFMSNPTGVKNGNIPFRADRILVVRGRAHTGLFVKLKEDMINGQRLSREFLGEAGAVYYTYDDALKREVGFGLMRSGSTHHISESKYVKGLASVMILNTFSSEKKAFVNIRGINRIASKIKTLRDLEILIARLAQLRNGSLKAYAAAIREGAVGGGYATSREWESLVDRAALAEEYQVLARLDDRSIVSQLSVEELRDIFLALSDLISTAWDTTYRRFDDDTGDFVVKAGTAFKKVIQMLQERGAFLEVVPQSVDDLVKGDLIKNMYSENIMIYNGFHQYGSPEKDRILMFLHIGDHGHSEDNDRFVNYQKQFRILKIAPEVHYEEVENAQDVGGIDLNPVYMKMKTSGRTVVFNARGVNVSFFKDVLGFTPVITGVRLAADFPEILK